VPGRERLEQARDAMGDGDNRAGDRFGLGKPCPGPQAFRIAHLDLIQTPVQEVQVIISFANLFFHGYSPDHLGKNGLFCAVHYYSDLK
jgi:hypothetical protein